MGFQSSGIKFFLIQSFEEVRDSFQDDVFLVVQTRVRVEEVTPLVFDLLHQSRVNFLDGVV